MYESTPRTPQKKINLNFKRNLNVHLKHLKHVNGRPLRFCNVSSKCNASV